MNLVAAWIVLSFVGTLALAIVVLRREHVARRADQMGSWWTPPELTKPFDVTTCPSCKNTHRHLYAALALLDVALHSTPPRDRTISRLVIICPTTGEPMHFALDAPNLMPAATPWGATR